MARKKEALTLSVPPGTKEKLEEIARQHNIMWGENPSASGLVVAIAQQELEIGSPFAFNSVQVQSLRQAIKALVDSGQMEQAQTLITLLLERGNPDKPLQEFLFEQISQPTESWRKVLDQHIQNQQPFILFYRNSQKVQETFTVRHAQIEFIEKRYFIMAWCEETAGSQEIPELVHNRCFRIERILNLIPVSEEWRNDLDYVEVQIHLKGWLANAYEPKPRDIDSTMIDGIRQVTRKIPNTFWFIREVFHYGKDCEIVAPDSIRNQMKEEVRSLGKMYDLEIND